MPAKQVKQPVTHVVNVKIDGELSVTVTSLTLEDAITEVRKLSFEDIVSGDYDNLSLDTQVTGVFRNF